MILCYIYILVAGECGGVSERVSDSVNENDSQKGEKERAFFD